MELQKTIDQAIDILRRWELGDTFYTNHEWQHGQSLSYRTHSGGPPMERRKHP